MPITPEEYAQALKGQGNWVAPEALGPSYWPSQNDVAFAHKYDATYGSKNAPNVTPGAATVANAPYGAVNAWRDAVRSGIPARAPADLEPHLNDQADANRAMAQHLAANRSAVAQLGYDTGVMSSTPNEGGEAGTIPISGFYNRQPNSGLMWYDQATPAAAMHESMHRGLDLLREQGHKIPVGFGPQEEAVVRALMNHTYGEIELKNAISPGRVANRKLPAVQQMEKGREMRNDPIIDQLEALAAAEIARKHPGGPR